MFGTRVVQVRTVGSVRRRVRVFVFDDFFVTCFGEGEGGEGICLCTVGVFACVYVRVFPLPLGWRSSGRAVCRRFARVRLSDLRIRRMEVVRPVCFDSF